jgi:hypothetical protein
MIHRWHKRGRWGFERVVKHKVAGVVLGCGKQNERLDLGSRHSRCLPVNTVIPANSGMTVGKVTRFCSNASCFKIRIYPHSLSA